MAIAQRYTLLAEMRLEQTLANYLRKILEKSARQLTKDVSKLSEDGDPLTKMQLEAQRKSIQAMLEQDFSNIENAVAQGKVEAAREASRVVSRYESELLKAALPPAAVARVAKSESQRAVAGLEAALQRMRGRSYKPLSDQVYNTQKLASGWINDTINKALASGWDARRLAKEIRQSISPDVPGGVSYAANRLARTEINNAYHAASADRYMNSPIVESVDWHLSTSHPEGDICDQMAEEGPYDKDKVPEKPHPNCYCYITPHLPTQEEFMANLLSGKYDDAAWADEVAADKAFGADLKDILEMEDEGEIWSAFSSVFEGQDYNGFKTEIGSVQDVMDGLALQMRITKDGKEAGFVTRVFGEDSVYHDTLELMPEFRGQGFSSAFSAYSESWYKASGISEIKLHAALGDGGYVWAKAGYTWDLDFYRKNADAFMADYPQWSAKLERMLADWPNDSKVTPKLYDIYNAIEEALDDPDILEDIDLAALANLQDDDGMFVGRLLLAGTSWRGRKTL